ncbi:hypothetical protein K2227_09625 [Shewanella putrefaciens]|nr:hypothetical protein K2227_09625 [Shewanella putrefaciens]
MVIKVKYLSGVIACLLLTACSVSSSIQRVEKSKSGFDGAVYEGEETIIRNDIPDSEAYRIFHQGATGFVSVQSVRNSAENRAESFCENKGLCSGQLNLATALESSQNLRSDSFGLNPAL